MSQTYGTILPGCLVGLALMLMACVGQSAPAATPTTELTETPQPTLAPTLTASPAAPSATPTIPATAVTEGTSGSLDCQVQTQAIKNGRHFSPGQHFDMGWMVRNTGSASWDPNEVYFTYYGGTKMYASTPTRLQQVIASGDTVLLVADLVAPKNPAKYTTVWALKQADQFFCQVRLTIYVP